MSQQPKQKTKSALHNDCHQGIVEEITEQGNIIIHDVLNPGIRVQCTFLRATTAPAPDIEPGNQVLYLLTDADRQQGCVLGIEEPYVPKKDRLKDHLTQSGKLTSISTIEDQVVYIKASEGLAIECGEGTIIISKDGKIQIKGTEVTSRARGKNRVKGAGVDIN
ncbi:MAG: hypothetical protein GXP08_18800 [Gammaproteobacteria bacterium]|nr:hypothetical protein [Gammaproteobacteria bacterium]